MRLRPTRFASLVPILAALAVNTLQPIAATWGGFSLSSHAAFAGSTVRMNAPELLKDMRGSLAEMAFSFKGASGDSKRRSGVAVLAAITQATRAVQQLESVIGTQNPTGVSRATKNLSKAVGDLQTRYSLSSAKATTTTKALRRFNLAWTAYSNRFILQKPKNAAATASASEVRALRKRVSDLSVSMQKMENAVADNASLRSEVARMRREIVLVERSSNSALDYQRLSFTLTVLSGSFAALTITTREYYPVYYIRISDFDRYSWLDGYWDGYYNGYYDGLEDAYYNEPEIIDNMIFPARDEVVENVSYETIYNVTNETTHIYESMPEEDLSETRQSEDNGGLPVETPPDPRPENPTDAAPEPTPDQGQAIPEDRDDAPPQIPSPIEPDPSNDPADDFGDVHHLNHSAPNDDNGPAEKENGASTERPMDDDPVAPQESIEAPQVDQAPANGGNIEEELPHQAEP